MKKGFTLIELLVVIVIIGILATLATVGLNSVRAKARDSKRISDIRQMQSALELYMNDNNSYPTNGDFVIGTPLDSPDGKTTYMSKIPSNPKPWAEGACSGSGAEYTYSYINANSYQLSYCLANKVNDLPAGQATAKPGNINNACTPNCSGKICGSDGCGGTCPGTTCSGGTPFCKTDGSSCVACIADTNCSGGTPYCIANVCSAPDFSPACTSGTALGTACGGGWLICKPSDGNCVDSPSNYVVVSPVNNATVNTWTVAASTCSSYSNAGYSGWTLPKLSSDTGQVTTLSGDRVKNEMCQLMKRSNLCANMTTSGGCSGGCLTLHPVDGLSPEAYWSANEYNATIAWLQVALYGNQDNFNKIDAHYVRCVRRF